MSIQVYECSVDGDFDLHQRMSDPIQNTQACPTCGAKSEHVFRPSAPVQVERTWNDRANEQQRNKYTMAEASMEDHRNAQRNLGRKTSKLSREDTIKVVEGIDKADASKKGSVKNGR